ncbi:MAG: hypothetical protein WB615_02590 [Candidatus Tumulicola sp.]
MRYLRWAAPAVLTSAVLALSACGGGGMSSTTPAAPGLNGVAGAMHTARGKHLTVVGHYNAAPPCNYTQFPDGCYSFSQTLGLTVFWCFGTQTDPCEDTSQLSGWSGPVKRIATGLTATRIAVAFSGPFPCDGIVCTIGSGTYETDAMTVRNNRPPRRAHNYIDQQTVNACVGAGCADLGLIGINIVGSPP